MDYCRRCPGKTIAIAERTFDVLHVLWIPLLPLWFRTRWYCGICRRRPHDPPETRGPVRLLAAAFFLALAALFWIMHFLDLTDPAFSTDPVVYRSLAIAMTVLFVLAAVWAGRYRDDGFAAHLEDVAPFEGHVCPMCDGQLEIRHTLKCRDCGAEHRPLR